MVIPKIIHQTWSGLDGSLPKYLETLGKTWKYDYPDWKYELWDNDRMNKFVVDNYPEYWLKYNQFKYNIQRWDIIRYLILNKIGGMYVDFDYESVKSLDELLYDKTCFFSQEPVSHYKNRENKIFTFNNALMGSLPNHFFMTRTIKRIFSDNNIEKQCENKAQTVFETTGPYILNQLYEELTDKEKIEIYLIPPEFVSPFNYRQSYNYRKGLIDLALEASFKEAYAIHYFLGTWLPK
ncbi:glycosyltransferase family 32 protein [Proteiniphilum acetatigenes]|uniref:glycosyltransferase family 32 protein n=1 Tax=Proteiniphilum acetatigenes TaxID=294710 RepID=UPI000377AEB0|nr:glycosyltransferase [Proteiniphilum acetatigenes]SFL63605.1 Glycosyltransferase sugar-binding region containing DXD motif-containing protein [Porphyromonadaceae bacterium KH3CP3RA]